MGSLRLKPSFRLCYKWQRWPNSVVWFFLPLLTCLVLPSGRQNGGCCLGCLGYLALALAFVTVGSISGLSRTPHHQTSEPVFPRFQDAREVTLDGIQLGMTRSQVEEIVGSPLTAQKTPLGGILYRSELGTRDKAATMLVVYYSGDDLVDEAWGTVLRRRDTGRVLSQVGQGRRQRQHLFGRELAFRRHDIQFAFEEIGNRVALIKLKTSPPQSDSPNLPAVNGVSLGMSREETEQALGRPDGIEEDGAIRYLASDSVLVYYLDGRCVEVWGTRCELDFSGKVIQAGDSQEKIFESFGRTMVTKRRIFRFPGLEIGVRMAGARVDRIGLREPSLRDGPFP